MYSAFIIHFATDVLAQGQQQKPKSAFTVAEQPGGWAAVVL